MATVDNYTGLITSQHQAAPKFMQMVQEVCKAWADNLDLANSISSQFDLLTAVGDQLDKIGQWVGVSRQLAAPLTGVYFAFDTANVGFDQGIWQGPFDPTTGLVSLPDDYYRLLLMARILNNHWNGSTPDALVLMNQIMNPYGFTLYIQDNADLSMGMILLGSGAGQPLVQSMLSNGLLNVKPAGVRINYYALSASPAFAFDIANTAFNGFDVGNWATVTTV